MNKDKLLLEVTKAAEAGDISEVELLTAFRTKLKDLDVPFYMRLSMTHILYTIGAAIVLLGIILLITLQWDNLNSLARILVTLGATCAAYYEGMILYKHKKHKDIGAVAFVIASALLPIGLYVTIHELNADMDSLGIHTMIALVCTLAWGASYKAFDLAFFLAFAILGATWAFFIGTEWMFEGNHPFDDFTAYRFLFVSISYALIGYGLRKPSLDSVSHFFESVGIIAFFITALVLSDYEPNQNFFWETIYPGLVFGGIYLGISLQKQNYVVISAIALMAYIIKLTSEYFSDALGWPFSLVLTGFALIGIGLWTKRLNDKYLTPKQGKKTPKNAV